MVDPLTVDWSVIDRSTATERKKRLSGPSERLRDRRVSGQQRLLRRPTTAAGERQVPELVPEVPGCVMYCARGPGGAHASRTRLARPLLAHVARYMGSVQCTTTATGERTDDIFFLIFSQRFS